MKLDDPALDRPNGASRTEKTRASWFPVFHVPHDGNEFPGELLESVCVPSEIFMACHEAMRDKDVGALIPPPYRKRGHVCAFAVSRLLCDVERFIGPEEVMERYGMGFCYEKAFDGSIIKRVTEELKEKTRAYYDAHHERINRLCAQHRHLLLIDLHSYSAAIIPEDFLRKETPLPDLCVGADGRFTPPELARTVVKEFQAAGLTVAVNYPYRGCYVPEAVMDGKADCTFAVIMLEMNRNAYLHDRGEPDGEKIRRIREIIRNILLLGF